LIRLILLAQGVYYLVTGIWPIVSMSTFEAVTGPKTDDWLVHMVGALAAAIGLTLIWSVRRGNISTVTVTLAATAAMAFAAIDAVYVANGTISKIYLADAAVEGIILAGLMARKPTER
jgi:energy-converting hydrogenase Eha subunit E